MSQELNPTIDVRKGEELDIAKLDPVLKQHIAGLSGLPEITQFPAGASNLTYLLKYPERELVLRRPPSGKKAGGAHSMSREVNAMNGVRPAYPTVPDILYYTDDASILGGEFYVMDKVEGLLVKKAIPDEWGFGDAERVRFCKTIFDKLIELHKVDYKAVGMESFGKPEGYVKRQVTGWCERFVNANTEDVPDFADVRQWLHDKMPATEVAHSVIHGDFRIDNVMLDPSDPFKVVTVLDWEMATLGDPLMDLGNALAYWFQIDDSEEMQMMAVQPSNVQGMMTRAEILAYYSEQTGFDTSHFDYYMVFGYFRLAGIMQQIYYRYFHKQTQDERFAIYGYAATMMCKHCQKLIAASVL